jgi:peroxiredoxin
MRVARLAPRLSVPLLLALMALAPAAAAATAAPPITVTLLGSGQRFDSRTLIGKKILVVRFQASWCRVCQGEAESVERAYARYRDRGVEFLGVHVQDTAEDVRRFLAAHRATYPIGLDPSLRTANRFGFKGTPYTVVIDRKGEIVARLHGRADGDRIAGTLDPLLKARPPRKPPPRRLQ